MSKGMRAQFCLLTLTTVSPLLRPSCSLEMHQRQRPAPQNARQTSGAPASPRPPGPSKKRRVEGPIERRESQNTPSGFRDPFAGMRSSSTVPDRTRSAGSKAPQSARIPEKAPQSAHGDKALLPARAVGKTSAHSKELEEEEMRVRKAKLSPLEDEQQDWGRVGALEEDEDESEGRFGGRGGLPKRMSDMITDLTERMDMVMRDLRKVVEFIVPFMDQQEEEDGEGKPFSRETLQRARSEQRDTIFQQTVRATLIGMMDIISSSYLPDPLTDTLPDGTLLFWEEKADSSKVLRPRWDLDWDINEAGWSEDAVEKIQLAGWRWNSKQDKVALEMMGKNTIRDAVKTVFDGWKRQYGLSKKDKNERDVQSQKRKRTARKHKKADYRTEVRNEHPEARKSKFDFAFEPQYQSTDESVPGDMSEEEGSKPKPVFDPASGDEEEETQPQERATYAQVAASGAKIKVPRKKKSNVPWITRTPLYRAPKVNQLLDEVDGMVKRDIHPRARGPPKDTPLPKARVIKGVQPPRIPLEMVDETWLEANPASRVPSLIDFGTFEEEVQNTYQLQGPAGDTEDVDEEELNANCAAQIGKDNNQSMHEDDDGSMANIDPTLCPNPCTHH
ncbi:hypothetical protein BV25DRAFT_1838101 [Artomyces pyxidatus]|uniref:Uncharacterized protein n=1 Tax=Artomyces pyxidatus TaxID=48021 RepID=A0ACB8T381_9AGAM|nr:hypothetical protein BV25DRAFT_1838101 [Artomyces pyxidatus]